MPELSIEHVTSELSPLPPPVSKEIWSAGGIDMSISYMERVQTSLIRAAELLREDDRIAEANRFFAHCVEGLERFYEAVTITKELLKLDPNGILIEGVSLTHIEKDFGLILKAIISHQEKKDYPEIADKIEYELLTNLSLWKKALLQLRAEHSTLG